ncbi:uncharacterized protein BT62DRAFT_1013846 [Guyanagaster necrorhizus]|uniref:Uncharacterized protein n=1 Tax=Guyanagaster necrorhizus TaxID=856835 RepID=A0A9P7VEP0_9AGAR|nr:uncharacterized protein BT62DRAFT_1013846 [Guyanagaster necrorhizus MCA 3950]KAG7439546.1 hypothetical protein BT62DRAFT_1013846 [Guyanagaster necrorhizus MCA 3950]
MLVVTLPKNIDDNKRIRLAHERFSADKFNPNFSKVARVSGVCMYPKKRPSLPVSVLEQLNAGTNNNAKEISAPIPGSLAEERALSSIIAKDATPHLAFTSHKLLPHCQPKAQSKSPAFVERHSTPQSPKYSYLPAPYHTILAVRSITYAMGDVLSPLMYTEAPPLSPPEISPNLLHLQFRSVTSAPHEARFRPLPSLPVYKSMPISDREKGNWTQRGFPRSGSGDLEFLIKYKRVWREVEVDVWVN